MDCCGRHLTRRQLLRTASVAAAGLALTSRIGAQGQKTPRVDVHAHVWTDEYLDLVQSYGKTDTGIQRNKGAGISDKEMDARFAQMDANGIDIQVLSICPQAPIFENKEHAVTAAKKANDLYAEVVQKWPKRFRAYVALPLPHVDESLKELDRGLNQLKMIGATITTSIVGRSVADPAFMPVYDELNRRHSILYIHPAGVGAESPLIENYQIIWMIGAPIEDTISITHLITHGIPMKYPRMKIINSHLGGAIPMLLQRLDNQYVWENPKTPEKPSISAKRMWYDTVGHGHPPALRAAVDSFGAERLVLGSDWPYEPGPLYKRAVDYISMAGLKQEDVIRIRDRNAAELLEIT
jgi:6-methylsalicylate decarboxylase